MLEQRMSGDPGYGGVAKVMHWLIVVLVAAQFAIAWTMPDIGRGTRPEGLISLHLTLGITIIVVALLRLAWRWTHPVPLISGNVPPWQHRAAQATHALLYVVLVLLPLMGWANASYRGWRVTLYGVATLPPLLPQGSPLGAELGDIHVLTSYVLLGLVGLHVVAALYHHFLLRDRVLLRMLPGGG